MAQISFDMNELKVAAKKMGDSDDIILVGDQGVYLMAHGKPETVVYAKGINPKTDDFDSWWDKKHRLYGGDDGVDSMGEASELKHHLTLAVGKTFWVKFTKTQLAYRYKIRN